MFRFLPTYKRSMVKIAYLDCGALRAPTPFGEGFNPPLRYDTTCVAHERDVTESCNTHQSP